MPRVGITRAYKYIADRFYVSRASPDMYMHRYSDTYMGFSGAVRVAGVLAMALNRIINVGEPTGENDAARKVYVDDAIDTDIAAHAALYTLHTKTARNTVDQIVNDSTTLVNATGLVIAVAANEVWALLLYFKGNSGVTPDFKVGWTVPSGTTMLWGKIDDTQAVTTESGTLTLTGYGTNRIQLLQAVVVVSTTAGNVQLQFAQNTQDASNTTLLANSCIIAHKIA